MLSSEEAKKQLKQFENPNGYLEAGIRVSGLSSRLKEIGAGLLEGAERLYGSWTTENQARWEAAKKGCEQLGDKDRRKLFDALFPSIGHHIDASWQMQKAGTYQAGYLRRAFRAPHSTGVTAAVRADWLATVMRSIIPYRYDLDFLVGWAPYLRWGAEPSIGLLLAAVLNSTGVDKEKTYAGLTAILRGEHPVGSVARHVTTAMLCCSRPEAWEAIERLLLAAQRQEGLRQVVLETIDFAHPHAFIRMLRLIEHEKLSRFAAVTRAVAVWFGMSPDSSEAKWIDQRVVELADNLESEPLRRERLESADGQTVYLALWSLAYFDAEVAAKSAEAMLRRPEFEPRYAAARLLSQLGITSAIGGLKTALADPDLRVAVEAVSALSFYRFRTSDHGELFEPVAALVDRSPKKKSLGSVLWEWNKLEADQGAIAAKLVALRTDQPWSRVTAYLPVMSADGRQSLIIALVAETKKSGQSTAETRQIALDLLADASNSVRAQAFKILEHAIPTPSEAAALEPLLSRKSSDLRRGVIRLLLNQPRPDAKASADRLSQARDAMMRQAGEELLTVLQPKAVEAEPPAPKTIPIVKPTRILLPLFQKGAAPRILRALDALVASKREVPVQFKTGTTGKFDDLLGNVRYLSVSPDGDMPLKETWRNWWDARANELRDPDGLELPRAAVAVLIRSFSRQATWHEKAISHLKPDVDLQFAVLDTAILHWLLLTAVPEGAIACLLDALESTLHGVAEHHVPIAKTDYSFQEWQSAYAFSSLLRLVHSLRWHHLAKWTIDEWRRYWNLLRWVDLGLPGNSRHRPALQTTLEAHRLGVALDADLIDHLVGGGTNGSLRRYDYSDFARLTRRKKDKLFDEYPALHSFVEDCKKKALEMELKRGDLPTAMSGVALAMKSISEPGLALRILKVLGKEKFARGYIYDAASKTSVHSHLLRISLPAEGETFDTFRQQVTELAIADSRLVDLAVYAPHWAPFVEYATRISGLETVAFWLHAHTKDQYWEVDEQIRELWFAEVSERTPLSKQDLLDGAVDVEWFRQMYAAVGCGVWQVVLESARYASCSGGHKRAELFASALLGEIDATELTERIQEKRHQDSVRALGLIPLKKGAKASRKELLSRYETLQQFIKESRQFGSQRQASEKLAAEIGLANLARTAGYPDPQRLSWAMEAEALGDLRGGSIEVTEGGVRVTLSIDGEGEAHLVAEKNGKELKEIPVSLRKVPSVAAMRTRKSQLGQQTSRMRRSLEESMIRGDVFTASELRELSEHPLLRPMLNTLIFVTPATQFFHGDAIADSKESARIAHPVDLLESGNWRQEQQICLTNAVRQPFKQAFRELYILTAAERREKTSSSRYEGHQVNPAQALATVGKRGWVNVPEEGLRRTFHHEGISAWVSFLNGWFTPTEVDGLTVEHVLFTRRYDGKVVDLDQVNPRVFSEVMRDLDLMVSVAHRGGVDPEASESTTEMRAALIRETVLLLKIENVRLSDRHVLVDGTLGSYNIHLGSGVVHRQPGGSLCIIPVHSQHRGRIFLPFADDDPKTAEIISKVLLLSKDNAIQDPTILEQLR
jgi:hypothetical protein